MFGTFRVVIVIAAMVMTIAWLAVGASDKKLDSFARCLSQKKAHMYGVEWCPHCAEQKEMFGSSFQYVNYTDCAIPGTHTETDECKALNIKHTPTWIFSDGQRREGSLPLQELGKLTGCPLR